MGLEGLNFWEMVQTLVSDVLVKVNSVMAVRLWGLHKPLLPCIYIFMMILNGFGGNGCNCDYVRSSYARYRETIPDLSTDIVMGDSSLLQLIKKHTRPCTISKSTRM